MFPVCLLFSASPARGPATIMGVGPPESAAMSTAASPRRMTAEEFLALPEDGMDRWLLNGELYEKPVTYRNRFHSRVLIRLAHLLEHWLEQQPEPRGQVLGGEAGVRLSRSPDSIVGIDVVYVSA